MRTVTVEHVVFGEGKPKIIVPLVGTNRKELLHEAELAAASGCDLVEWRMDHYEEVANAHQTALLSKEIKKTAQLPLLLTFRTKNEGGAREFSNADYFQLYDHLLLNGAADLMDVELFLPEKETARFIAEAHRRKKVVIMSNHEFEKTPSKETLIHRLLLMQKRGADICKFAVMPREAADVLTLLDATQEMYHQHADRPLITMSMGELGVISRISGATFGSAATFGTVKTASAPGQLAVAELKRILDIVSF